MRGGSNLTAVQIERKRMPVDQAVFVRRVIAAAEHQIPQRIGNLLALVGLYLLHDVRMVTNDQIRALVDAVASDCLLGRIAVIRAFDPPMIVEYDEFRSTLPPRADRIVDKLLLRAAE